MATLDENKDTLNKLIKLFDELLDSDEWNQGIYLQTMSTKVKELRSDVETILNEFQGSQAVGAVGAAVGTQGAFVNVYVSLYQSDSGNVLMWQKTLKRINEFSTSRPIYRDEEHVKQLIRARPDPTKEGYAIVHVKESDMIKAYSGKQQADRFGNELLTIREGAIKPESIVKFVHGQKVYDYKDGQLTQENEGS